MAESQTETGGQGTPFYCHECKKEILVTIADEDPSCPDCQSFFLEALDEQEEPEGRERAGRRSPTDAELQESLSWRLGDIDPATGSPRNPMDDMHIVVNSLMEATNPMYRGSWPPAPMRRIQERRRRIGPIHVHTVLRTQGPPTLLRVANDLVGGVLPGGLPFPFPLHNMFGGLRNLGDYVTSDRSLDDIVSQLLNHLEGGAPPADNETIDNLPKVTITQIFIDQAVECSVCQDKFVMDEEVCQLTKCEHLFHTDCITPWLKLHDTCPVCRIPVGERGTESASHRTAETVFGDRNQFDEPSDMTTDDN